MKFSISVEGPAVIAGFYFFMHVHNLMRQVYNYIMSEYSGKEGLAKKYEMGVT